MQGRWCLEDVHNARQPFMVLFKAHHYRHVAFQILLTRLGKLLLLQLLFNCGNRYIQSIYSQLEDMSVS